MQNLWNPNEQILLERIKKDIIAGPILSRPGPYRRFYINTDWSTEVMGVVLLWEDDSVKAINKRNKKRTAYSVNLKIS